jgi:hypothetical protein
MHPTRKQQPDSEGIVSQERVELPLETSLPIPLGSCVNCLSPLLWRFWP